MSSVPLQVRLGSKLITRQLSDLSFRKTIPGGYASAGFQLHDSIARSRPDREMLTDVAISDTRHGRVCWQGVLEDPGRSSAADGETWDMVAIGPSGHANERNVPAVYVDRQLDHWVPIDRGGGTSGGNQATGEQAGVPGGGTTTGQDAQQALVFTFPQGMALATNARAPLGYRALADSGQRLGGIQIQWLAGLISTSLSMQIVTGQTNGSGRAAARSVNASTTDQQLTAQHTTDFPLGNTIPELRFIWTAAGTTVPAATHWAAARDVWVRAILLNKSGVDLTGAYANGYVTNALVVGDLLGRLLTRFDGPNAVIDSSSTFQIEQMQYVDGASARQIFDDLMALDSDFFWAAWEGTPARFEWSKWPTAVRYEFKAEDGFSSPQSSSEIYNRAPVRWRDARGETRSWTVSNAVPALDSRGIIREAPVIDLGDEIGSRAMAIQVGNEFLRTHAYPTNAGTIQVSRPVRNLLTGQRVWPHEIDPGCLVRVRGVEGSPSALNLSTEDGVNVFRMVATDYRASENAVTCELSSPARTQEEIIARIAEQRRRKR